MKTFRSPPLTQRDDGTLRRVGVEIELGALSVEETAATIVSTFGGTVERTAPFVYEVHGTNLGHFRVELDTALLKSAEHHRVFDAMGVQPDSPVVRAVDEALESAAGQIVPCEIVTDPLELTQLPELDNLRIQLRNRGAQGTKAAPWYAFGVHFNPELVSGRAESLLRYLQAFLILEPNIRRQGRTDWARRVTPFIDPFPDAYRSMTLERRKAPERRALIFEYLRFNPSRNRSLDMLPAFKSLEPEFLTKYVQDPRVKARPTFHYRLANSRIDETDWTIAEEWNRWVEVEELAESTDRLRARADAWLATESPASASTS